MRKYENLVEISQNNDLFSIHCGYFLNEMDVLNRTSFSDTYQPPVKACHGYSRRSMVKSRKYA